MELNRILNCIEIIKIIGKTEIEVTGLAHKSEDVREGFVFFCLRGTKADGHTFAGNAVKAGARVLVVEKAAELPDSITQIVVADSRSAMAVMAGNFYSNPARRMKVIGITGTNGKTTTSYIIKAIGEAAGKKVGLIGTTGIYIDGVMGEPLLTTPDPIDLHRVLAQMCDCGTDWVVMEVSAHAIELKKMDGIVADVAVFTNLSQDHLDYFGTIERYKAAKKRFFTPAYARAAVVNIDDKAGQEIFKERTLPLVTYGNENPADAFGLDYTAGSFGVRYIINVFDKLYEVEFALPGRFNMYNSMCALLTAYLLHIPVEVAAKGIRELKYVPGRFNVAAREPYLVIVDYAHTPDGLKNILRSIKEFAKGRIITVFGCGGDRDRTKRPIMGRVAAELSDYVVVTSDNPRSETPESIISQIVTGLKTAKFGDYIAIPERTAAINFALSVAVEGDVVLIAGKGDEKYQEINGFKIPYSDYDIVEEFLASGEQG